MAVEGDSQRVEKSLSASVKDGVLFSIMTGLGDYYMAPLLLFYGASDATIGLLTILPQSFAALAQLLLSRTAGMWRKRKMFVAVGCMLHAFFWLLQLCVLLSPLDGSAKIALALGLFTVYIGWNALISPVWSGWMADLVPEERRGAFFGFRNRATGLALFLSTLAGGVVLGAFGSDVALGFGVLFIAAFAARLGSSWYLSRMDEAGGAGEFREVKWRHLLFHHAMGNMRLFIATVSLMSFGVYMAAPFFAVFMLRDLHMSYMEYGVLISAALLAKIISFRYWGGLADRFGNRAVLVATGLLLVVVPLPWVVMPEFWVLFLAQLFSGFAWSGFELVTFNYALSSAQREQRVSMMSRYSVFSNVGIVGGAITGSVLVSGVLPAAAWGMLMLQILFLLSSCVRLVVALVFLLRVKEQKMSYQYDDGAFLLNASFIYPTRAFIRRAAGIGHQMKSGASKVARRLRKQKMN